MYSPLPLQRPHGTQVCGCYFMSVDTDQRQYLPQVKLDSKTHITPSSFSTNLRQVFRYSGLAQSAGEVRYCFPLYDGVAVSRYSIEFAGTLLEGVVEQKDDARTIYDEAIDRGAAATLLEALPAGLFGVTIGNIPAQTDVLVDITYCGELKHDAEIDGLRYVLPTQIAPRYGACPGSVMVANTKSARGMNITVDIDMGLNNVRKIQSPSHPISVTTGELSSNEEPIPFASSKASITLTLETAQLAKDFVLQLLVDDINKPQAVLEHHPTIDGQRAIMATLVPKFPLPQATPEIVFIADQSGSMNGLKNTSLVNALKIFIKSLPFGVRFNLCAFGSSFEFLWPKSQPYSEENVKSAIEFVSGFHAHHGGTELLRPIVETFLRRLPALPLEVMLLTDGEIWGEEAVFRYINKQIHGSDDQAPVDARVFALGIGADVSHSLVEGVARAGNGFAQFVGESEQADLKVMRMLKSALGVHTKNYSINVNYEQGQSTELRDVLEEDYEVVEKTDKHAIPTHTSKPTVDSHMYAAKKPIPFFDEGADVSDAPAKGERYAHLPQVEVPDELYAPTTIPPLYNYSRTTVYAILDPRVSQNKVKSITVRATAGDQPLELTLPVYNAGTARTIHQLAARKAIQELEEGRGWIRPVQKSQTNTTEAVESKDKIFSLADELAEREAVRLGKRFQVAGKWTSFVAVEKLDRTEEGGSELEPSRIRKSIPTVTNSPSIGSRLGHSNMRSPKHNVVGISRAQGHGFPQAPSTTLPVAPYALPPGFAGYGGAMMSARYAPMPAPPPPAPVPVPAPAPAPSFFPASSLDNSHKSRERSAAPDEDAFVSSRNAEALQSVQRSSVAAYQPVFGAAPISSAAICNPSAETSSSPMRALIDLQGFSGLWNFDENVQDLLGISPEVAQKLFEDQVTDIHTAAGDRQSTWMATVLAVAYLQKNHGDQAEVWELVADKAKNALRAMTEATTDQVEVWLHKAQSLWPNAPKQ